MGFGWTTYDHTAGVMVVHAFGPGAEMFTGFMDNTDVAKLIMKITFDLNYVGCEPNLASGQIFTSIKMVFVSSFGDIHNNYSRLKRPNTFLCFSC
ncbi:hypothetical protein [Pseudothermotoga sp.]